jgi:hypothetical protein
MRGRGILNLLKKAQNFLRGKNILGSAAKFAGNVLPPQYAGIANTVGSVIPQGYGRRRRRRCGRGLRLAGMR